MKKLLWPMAAALLLVATVQPFALSAEKEKPEPSTSQGQMKQVLANQEKILTTLEEIKKELQIIKVRATR